MPEPSDPFSEAQKVQANLRSIITVVTDVKIKVNEYLKELRTLYYEYLKSQTNQNTGYLGGNANSVPDHSFNEVDSEYKKIVKNLSKINKHISLDHAYAVEFGNAVLSYHLEYQSIINDIETTKMLPQSTERSQRLAKLYKKYPKIVKKYNQAALKFNEYITKFHALHANLQTGVFILSSNTSGKTYSITIEQIIEWFKSLTDNNNDISKLRNQIIQRTIPTVTQTTVSLETSSELKEIHGNLKIMTTFVNQLTKKLSGYFDDLKTHYVSYLKLLKPSSFTTNTTTTIPTTPTSTPSSDAPNTTASSSTPGYSFKNVDSVYQKLTKTLHKIIQSIGNDFLEIQNMANEIKTVHDKIKGLENEIKVNKTLPNSLEKFNLTNRLSAKYLKKVMKYNELVAAFNDYASKLTSTKQYLDNDLIIYSSNSSGKKYSLSIKQIINWFKDLASTDEISSLRGEIIGHMTKSYSTDLNTLINTPPLTSISVMDPYPITQHQGANQPPSTPTVINNPPTNTWFMGAPSRGPQVGTQFMDMAGVGTPTRVPVQGYGTAPAPQNISQVIKEELSDSDDELEMIE